ncbi:hypothetical protein JZ751_010555 [Albula glossodonta]|uniref:Uncharacterized protein n=1 Tax=Albula glossodonta TaxID=121402 RepID=A0A8T2NXK2_9TELE|nr:hypothetical protein JZ751_010555 [Albula glossodonta]
MQKAHTFSRRCQSHADDTAPTVLHSPVEACAESALPEAPGAWLAGWLRWPLFSCSVHSPASSCLSVVVCVLLSMEPNLLSSTAHSVNKRGVKRRDLDPEELKEILSPLLPCVRLEHILPANSEVLSDTVRLSPAHATRLSDLSRFACMKRGLISTPPSDMLPTAEGGRANSWLQLKSSGIYLRPRLFSPYAEEAKVQLWSQGSQCGDQQGLYSRARDKNVFTGEYQFKYGAALDEMMVEHTDLVRLRMVRMSNVPDTLYMVNNATPQCCHMTSHPQTPSGQAVPPSVVANEIPVPRLAVVKQMTGRLQELRRMDLAQRAYSLSCGEGSSVSHALQLRVLREFGLPDGAAELLQQMQCAPATSLPLVFVFSANPAYVTVASAQGESPHKFFPEECFGDESPVLALRQSGRCQASSQAVLVEGVAGFHPPLPPPPPPYHPPATPGHGHTQLKAGWRPGVHPHPPQPPSRSFSYPCNPPFLPWRPTSKQGSPAPQSDCTDPQVVARPSYPGQQGQHMEPAVSELMPDVAVAVSSLSLREGPESKGHDLSSDTPSSSTSVPQYYLPGLCHASLQHGHHQGPHQKHGAEPDSRAGFPDLYTLPCHPASRHAAPNLQAFCVAGPDLYSHNHARPPGGPPRPSLHPDLALGDPLLNKMEMDTPCGMNQTRPLTVAAETQRLGALENMGGGVLEGAASSRDHRSPSKPEYTYRNSTTLRWGPLASLNACEVTLQHPSKPSPHVNQHTHSLAVNSPENYLLYSHMGTTGHYTDFVRGSWKDKALWHLYLFRLACHGSAPKEKYALPSWQESSEQALHSQSPAHTPTTFFTIPEQKLNSRRIPAPQNQYRNLHLMGRLRYSSVGLLYSDRTSDYLEFLNSPRPFEAILYALTISRSRSKRPETPHPVTRSWKSRATPKGNIADMLAGAQATTTPPPEI